MTPDAAAEASGGPSGLSGARVAILGCGAVGSALAVELAREGSEIVLWSRTRARAEAVAERLTRQDQAGVVATAAVEAIEGSRLVLLCVTDAVLATFAEEQAEKAPRAGTGERAVVHTNGFHALEVLAPWRAVGWEAGKLHPLTSLPPDGGGRLRGAWFATASNPGGRVWIQRLLSALGGRELLLDDEEATSRTIHAAAALLSGGVLILESISLAHVPAGRYTLVCAPLRIAGAEAAPARAILINPEGAAE